MIDRVGRDVLAEAVHGLLAKTVSVEDVYLRLPGRSEDLAVRRIQSFLFFCDVDGKDGIDFTRETRRAALRAIMFLRSDHEFEWLDALMDGGSCLLTLLTGGLHYPFWVTMHRKEIAAANANFKAGDFSVWPFYRKADYDSEYLKTCPFARIKAA